MKTKSSKAAFFNLRVLIGFALCSAGLVIAFAGLSKSVNGTLAAPPDTSAHSKHHHYKLIDIGTFGGPQSYVDGDGNGGFRVLNNHGALAGAANTSAPDPFPDFCFLEDCFVVHALQWQNGVLTDLGVLAAGTSSESTWISASGLVAGVAENGEIDPLIPGFPQLRAVLWQNGGITDLGTLPGGGYESFAYTVNSRAQVAGLALNTVPDPYSMIGLGYQTRAFLWQNGAMQDLGTLGGPDAMATSINEQGQIVGVSYTSSTPTQAEPCVLSGFSLTTGAFLWQNGQMVNLGSLGGTCTLANFAPNGRGQIVGESSLTGDQDASAFLWENGSIRKLAGSFGGHFTGAIAINDRGNAIGFADLPGDTRSHAALWTPAGNIVDLGVVDNDPCSYASALNAQTQVVGSSAPGCNFSGFAVRAFLWEDGSIVDLNTLIPSGSALHLQFAETINDRGEITGTGVDARGNTHAYLLIPCGEGDKSCEGENATSAAKSDSAPAMQSSVATNQSNPMRLFGRRAMSWQRGVALQTNQTGELPGWGNCLVNGSGKLTGYCLTNTPYGCSTTRSSFCPVGAEAVRKGTTVCCIHGNCGPPITIDVGRFGCR
jgi:probable HAF family extracellular repeat protein